jgi:hypothetical protein
MTLCCSVLGDRVVKVDAIWPPSLIQATWLRQHVFRFLDPNSRPRVHWYLSNWLLKSYRYLHVFQIWIMNNLQIFDTPVFFYDADVDSVCSVYTAFSFVKIERHFDTSFSFHPVWITFFLLLYDPYLKYM